MIDRLVVNGCSYMNNYANGNGHQDLADKLNITNVVDLSQSGCANARMIRTSLKDSYLTLMPTFYVIGLTFISRSESPILRIPNGDDELTSFEGRWTNPQNQLYKHQWEYHWSDKETDLFVELKQKEEVFSLIDRTENLMYALVSMIESVTSRGHKILIFQQADSDYFPYLDSDRLVLFKKYSNFLYGLKWCAVQWQHEQGVPINKADYSNKYGVAPIEIRHRERGKHQKFNEFLTQYIKDNKILE